MRIARPHLWEAGAPVAEREVLTELNALHARALQRLPLILAAAMSAILLFMWTPALSRRLILWALSVVGVECVRAWYATVVLRRADALDPRRVHRWMVALAALAGSTAGLGAMYFMPLLPLVGQAQLGIYLFVMPAAGVAVSQSSRYIVAAYSTTMIFPSALVWTRLHPSLFWSGALGVPVFCLLMTIVASDGDKLLRRSVLIRHERDRLVQDLEAKNAEVQVAVARAEAEARARAQVLAAASHDLRQPLHALSVYSAVLTAQPKPEVLAETGRHIVEMVRSLGSVLNGLLDLSRLSSGHYVPEREPVALEGVLAPVCTECGAAASAKGLALETDLQAVSALTDPVSMTRIARNLIDNAIKYTERGVVRVSLRAVATGTGSHARLVVSDTGRGISGDDQSRVFEEFFQVNNPGRDRSQGVGLGLAIVRRLCELLGATISVTSTLGSGSTFTVELPALDAAGSPHARASLEAAPTAFQGRRVYVVDDEIDVLRGTRTLLESWGLRARGAGSAASAEQLCIEHGPPDLLIADLRLGAGEHGVQLATRLRDRFGDFPVLIISGETSSAALEDANERSFPLLHKPVSPESFRAAVSLALGQGGHRASHDAPSNPPVA